MLRYDRQTKPGLVASYDIRPGNEAGLFLQPRDRTGHRDKTRLENCERFTWWNIQWTKQWYKCYIYRTTTLHLKKAHHFYFGWCYTQDCTAYNHLGYTQHRPVNIEKHQKELKTFICGTVLCITTWVIRRTVT